MRIVSGENVTIYFSASHSTKRFTAILGLLLLGFGIAITVLTAISPRDLSFILNYFFALFFVAAGSWLLKLAANAESTTLSITSEGVSYGTQSYSWNEIAQLGVMPGRKEFYCTPRSAPFAFEFSISRRPSAKQIKDLFELLEREIVRLYPHVQLRNGDEKSKR